MSSKCYLCEKSFDKEICVSHKIPDSEKLRPHGEDIKIFFCSNDCKQLFEKTSQCCICKSLHNELYTVNEDKICQYYVNDLSKLNVVLNSEGMLDKFKSESFIEFPKCVENMLTCKMIV